LSKAFAAAHVQAVEFDGRAGLRLFRTFISDRGLRAAGCGLRAGDHAVASRNKAERMCVGGGEGGAGIAV
jgi:hypothetical protein